MPPHPWQHLPTFPPVPTIGRFTGTLGILALASVVTVASFSYTPISQTQPGWMATLSTFPIEAAYGAATHQSTITAIESHSSRPQLTLKVKGPGFDPTYRTQSFPDGTSAIFITAHNTRWGSSLKGQDEALMAKLKPTIPTLTKVVVSQISPTSVSLALYTRHSLKPFTQGNTGDAITIGLVASKPNPLMAFSALAVEGPQGNPFGSPAVQPSTAPSAPLPTSSRTAPPASSRLHLPKAPVTTSAEPEYTPPSEGQQKVFSFLDPPKPKVASVPSNPDAVQHTLESLSQSPRTESPYRGGDETPTPMTLTPSPRSPRAATTISPPSSSRKTYQPIPQPSRTTTSESATSPAQSRFHIKSTPPSAAHSKATPTEVAFSPYQIGAFPAQKVDPIRLSNDAQRQYMEALARLDQNQPEESKRLLLQLVDTSTGAKFLPAYHELIYLHLNEGEMAKARTLVTQGLQQWPNDPILHYSLGVLSESDRQYKTAMDHYRKALAEDPSLFIAHYRLAMAALKTRQRDEAAWEFNRVLQQRPDDTSALKGLGFIAQQRQNWGEAKDYYQKALQPEILVNYAAILMKENDTETAAQLLQTARAIAPNNGGILYNVGMMLADAGKKREAKDALETYLQQRSNGGNDTRTQRAKQRLSTL